MILAIPHDEDAAAFLLHTRYRPLLLSIYRSLTQDESWFEDCIDELFIHLKGSNTDWHNLSSFAWRSSFGTWLKGVARNKFCEVIPALIENNGENLSIQQTDSGVIIQLPDEGEEEFSRNERKVMLLEAIGQLEDADQKFVILKRLQGYNSKEIAVLLQKRWEKHGIVKYNSKKEMVVPDAAYVDVRTQRAKENLKKIIINLQ